jgi:hypothetical protein
MNYRENDTRSKPNLEVEICVPYVHTHVHSRKQKMIMGSN